MVVTKQTKAYVISLTKQALTALKNNQHEAAEDYLRSAHGELSDAINDINDNSRLNVGFGINTGLNIVSTRKKLKFV